MSSPCVEDREFDDAALWAVIDSAEATLSSTAKSKPRRPQTVALKYPNFQSPPTPVSNPSPSFPSPATGHRHVSIPDPCTRPHKIPRPRAPELSPLSLVRSPCATGNKISQFRPESHLSPQIGKLEFDEASEVSPGGGEEGEVMRHCLNARFPSVTLFKDFQNAAMAILEKSDYTLISGNPFIKKSGWRKISLYFNISYEIKDKTIEFDDNRNVQRAEFVVRAHMQGGRFSDGWGSCERREKRFMKPNHDIPSTAETRAKNKACQDLLGIGEYRPGATQFHQ